MNADVQALLTLGMTGILAITSIGMMIASVYLARRPVFSKKPGPSRMLWGTSCRMNGTRAFFGST